MSAREDLVTTREGSAASMPRTLTGGGRSLLDAAHHADADTDAED
jgi:hypothetical protein